MENKTDLDNWIELYIAILYKFLIGEERRGVCVCVCVS